MNCNEKLNTKVQRKVLATPNNILESGIMITIKPDMNKGISIVDSAKEVRQFKPAATSRLPKRNEYEICNIQKLKPGSEVIMLK